MRVILVYILIFLTGCSLAPKYKRPAIALPESDKEKHIYYKNIKWWKFFNDEKLNLLVDNALKNNDNLKLAILKIEKAYSLLKESEAERLPLFTGNFNLIRNKSSKNYIGLSKTDNTFSPVLKVSYETDIWEKLKNSTKYNLSKLLAKEYIKDALEINIISNVVLTYIKLASVNMRMTLLKNILKNCQDIYKFRLKQYKHGIIDSLTVESAKGMVKYVKTLIESIKQIKIPLISTLSILTGESPEKLFKNNLKENQGKTLFKNLKIPPLLSSEILNNRPDIKAAEENLKAAYLKIGVIKAAYFPDITLTGLLGFKSKDLNNLISDNSRIWNIGGSIFQTILDFGRIKSNVGIAETDRKEAVINYAKTVKKAFKEVYDALNSIKIVKAKIEAENNYIESLEKILSLSILRFKAGSVDNLPVLNAKKDLLTERLNLIKYKTELLENKILFYKSLGCGY